MRRIKGQTGMSLVEALIILLVLMLLTGVLAPSIFEFIPDSKNVKVKEDCEAIGIELAKLIRDVGPCLKLNGAGQMGGPGGPIDTPCTPATQAQLLWSRGNAVAMNPALVPSVGPGPVGANWNFADLPGAPGTTLESQLVTNGPNYLTVGQKGNFNLTYPAFGLGWRGAYIAPPIGPDPWGGKYLVNSVYFTSAAYQPGVPGFDEDVFCISGGPNQVIDTPFQTNNVQVGVDDFIFVIQGSTR